MSAIKVLLTFFKILLGFLVFPALVARQAIRSRRFGKLCEAAKATRDRVVLKPGTDPQVCWNTAFAKEHAASNTSYELWVDGICVAPSDLAAVHTWEHATSTMASGFEEDAIYRFTVLRKDHTQTQEISFLLASDDRSALPILSAIPKGVARTSQSLGHSYGIGLLLLLPWSALAFVLTIAAMLWFGHKGRW